MRIGIRIDGVLTDMEQWKFDAGSKYFSKNNSIIIDNYKAYSIEEIFGISGEFAGEFWKENFLEYVKCEPPRKFSVEVINKLIADGHEVYIIGNRYLTDKFTEDGQKIRNKTRDWLNSNNINYHKLVFSNQDILTTCLENNIDIVIEEKASNIIKLSEKIPVFCFLTYNNQDISGRRIIRVGSWYDIYTKIISKDFL